MKIRLSALAAVGLALVWGGPGAAAHPAGHPAAARPATEATTLPPEPPAVMRGLIGEYGEGAEPEQRVVFESGGELYLAADGRTMRLMRLGEGDHWLYPGHLPRDLRFERDGRGRAVAVTIDRTRLPRRDVGAEIQARIRAGVRADPERLRARALAATPPQEPGPKRRFDLVELTTVDPTIRLDVRYAGADNFMGIPLYERAGAWMQRPAAEALGRAAASLRAKGYGLLIHDAYRPWFVTWMFWEATPADGRGFVADPARGSRHNRGAAVDLTLYDLATGRAVDMPSRYDEFSPRAWPDFIGGTTRQRWRRDLLRREMETQGFTVYPQEWWHFDYRDWQAYPIGNRTFTDLAAGG
jgi:D-alanyl-D-alanine dipeptidase